MPYLPLATRSDLGGWSGERLVNMIPHPISATGSVALLGRSGLRQQYTGTDGLYIYAMGIGRNGLCYVGNTKFHASGYDLTVPTAAGTSYLCGDANYVAAVINGVYRVHNGTAFSTPATGAITTPKGVCYQDGYFILWGSDGTRDDIIQWSDVDDATTFNALNFAAAETDSDAIEAIVPGIGGIKVFGSRTVEDWYLDGANGWRRNSPTGIRIGCREGKTAARHMERYFWVGRDNRVYEGVGSIAAPISPPWVESAITNHNGGSGSETFVRFGFIYKDRGHTMYCLRRETFDSETAISTLVFDLDTREWFEFSTGTVGAAWMATGTEIVTTGVSSGSNPPSANLTDQYVGTTDGIFKTDLNGWQDDTTDIPWSVTTPPINMGGQPMNLGNVRLKIDTNGDALDVDAEFANYIGDFKAAETRSVNTDRREAVWHSRGQYDPEFQIRFSASDDVRRDIYGISYGAS